MSNDQSDQKPQGKSLQGREGIKRRDLLLSGTSLIAAAAASGAILPGSAEAQEVLPFPPTPSASIAGRTMQESVYKPRVEPRRLPDDAPNILIILIDDVGPAQPSTYGGEINTPTLSRVAQEGISYNRFHSTAMCSPTRAALLYRAQPSPRRQRPDRRARQRLGRLSAAPSRSQRDRGRGAEELRLQHRRLGQVAQHAGRADHRQRAVRLLADRLRLRVLLRLPRRRSLAVRAAPGAQHDCR